jgi:uncharacterized repeat protein (TIGR01451 family)
MPRPTHNRLAGTLLLLLGLAMVIVPMVGVLATPTTVAAAPMASLPTETPMPPTPEPSSTPVPPTATPVPPTATPAPPTATPEPPPEEHRRPSPTPTATMTPPPPTATPEPVISITDIGVQKTADKAVAQPGELVRFSIRLFTVTGADEAADVVVRDAVPDAFEVVDLSSSKGDIVVSGQAVTAYPRTLAPGEEVLVTVTARVRAGVQPGSVVNTAIITTSTSTDTPDNNTSSTTVEIKVPVVIKEVPPPAPARLPITSDPLADQQALLSILPWTLVGLLLLTQGAMLIMRGQKGMIPVPIPVAPFTAQLGSLLGGLVGGARKRFGLTRGPVAEAPATTTEQPAETASPAGSRSGGSPSSTPTPVLKTAAPADDADAMIGPPLPEPGPSGPLPPIRPKDRRNL